MMDVSKSTYYIASNFCSILPMYNVTSILARYLMVKGDRLFPQHYYLYPPPPPPRPRFSDLPMALLTDVCKHAKTMFLNLPLKISKSQKQLPPKKRMKY